VTIVRARAAGVSTRLEALDEVLALARDRVDPDVVAAAERVAVKAGERLRFGDTHTVVALAGATGSGKSSLFNALAGANLSKVGMRRPTTGVAHAAVWGADVSVPLLDWLAVPRRHVVEHGRDTGLNGLVLLDLPDVDSVDTSHRMEADRLVERVDLLVWVLDPQKYADASLHDRYLAPLADHADVMLVVLNQADRLPERARTGCRTDLKRLLEHDGLSAVPIVLASAVTSEGLDRLREELRARVAARRAAVQRLEADLASVAVALDGSCSERSVAGVGRADRDALVAALSDAAGVEVVARAVGRAYRARARRVTGWPFTRWTARLRPDPARRLRLPESPSELVRTSLPGPSAVQQARVDSALRHLGERAATDLPEPWPTVVRRAATRRREDLPELLDRAIAGTDLGLDRRPRWWRAVGFLQWLLAFAAVVGALWLLALFGIAWLQLPEPPLPMIGVIPLPTLSLGGGLLLGLVLALASGRVAAVGAWRRARRARRRLHAKVERLAEEVVVTPVERELAAHTALCKALRRVRDAPVTP
jgi:GTP-binding protein EngB required for normal cell division